MSLARLLEGHFFFVGLYSNPNPNSNPESRAVFRLTVIERERKVA